MGVLSKLVFYSIPIIIMYTSMKQLKNIIIKYKEDCMWYKKHNCVVMYAKGEGMTGWPPYPGRIPLTINNLEKHYEPIIYFLETTKYNIDIAVMNISIRQVFTSLQSLLFRGVKVRMILDCHYTDRDKKDIVQLEKHGAQISHYIHSDIDTIMHYKFAVKDIDGGSGCVLTGSMNWSTVSVMDNYEDIVISMNKILVKQLQSHFDDAWEYLIKQKEYIETVEHIENETL